jgi:hypothetical protein
MRARRYAYAAENEGVEQQHLDEHLIAFHTAFPKPRRFDLATGAAAQNATLVEVGLRSGTLLRVLLAEAAVAGGGGGGGELSGLANPE